MACDGTVHQIATLPLMAPTPRILVVDDEHLVRMTVRLIMEDAGYAAVEAGSADDALSMLKSQHFDAVISDVEMPGQMSGLDLAWCITALWPGMGVVLMSGRSLPHPKDLPKQTRFIPKPCQHDHLLETVRDALGPSD